MVSGSKRKTWVSVGEGHGLTRIGDGLDRVRLLLGSEMETRRNLSTHTDPLLHAPSSRRPREDVFMELVK